jgi:hypothetical protein
VPGGTHGVGAPAGADTSLPRGVRREGRAAAVLAPCREERRPRAVTYLDHNAGTPLHPRWPGFSLRHTGREPEGIRAACMAPGRAARARLDAARTRGGASDRAGASGGPVHRFRLRGVRDSGAGDRPGGVARHERDRASLRPARGGAARKRRRYRCDPGRMGGSRRSPSMRRWPVGPRSAPCRRRTTRPVWSSPRTRWPGWRAPGE